MPELPEVETVRRGLEPRLVGHTFERVEILDGRLTGADDPVAFGMELDGDRVIAAGRRGKYLLIGLGERPHARRPPAHDGLVSPR